MNADKDGEWTLTTQQEVTFVIKNSPGLFDIGNEDVLGHGSTGKGSRRIVVIDQQLSELYLKKIVTYLNHYEIDYRITLIKSNEITKNLDTLVYLVKEFEQFGIMRRNEPIIAVGGGVLLDIVGMAAGMYRRGVPYIRIPTTLLGLVDASVGAKTGINFENRRNRLGSYFPPVAAYLDKSFLISLEPIEISSGMGEILKMAVVKDAALFEILKNDGETLYHNKFMACKTADAVINLAVKGMKDELQTNLWEKDLKRFVDFGHSFSPIIEMRSLCDNAVPTLTHGQAVTLDVIFSCILSTQRGMLPAADTLSVMRVAASIGLPTSHPYFEEPLLLLEALNDTMKHRNGDQNLPVPITIGHSTFLNDVTLADIKQAAISMKQFNQELAH